MDPNNPYQGPQAALLDTPRPGESTVGRARRRPVGHGLRWWTRAWSLVETNWVLWCLVTLVFFAVLLGISLLSLWVPMLGSFVPTLLVPVLSAGLCHLAWRRWTDDEFQFFDFFAGFSHRTGPLFVIGLIQLLLQVVYSAAMAAMALVLFGAEGTAFFGGAFGATGAPATTAVDADGAAPLLIGMVGAALFVPYMALIWFQAPLVYFGDRGAFRALGESFTAVLRNWLPMLWYNVIVMMVLTFWGGVFWVFFVFANTLFSGVSQILANALLGLAAAVSGLFLMAVSMISVYASFRDIFGADDEPEAAPEL